MYNTLLDRGIYGSAQMLENTVGAVTVYTPVIALAFVILWVILMFSDGGSLVTDNNLTRSSKLILLPVAILFTIYVIFGYYRLFNQYKTAIVDLSHTSNIQNISLEQLETSTQDMENAVIYINRRGCDYCGEITSKIDNTAYANHITIYSYDTVYDRTHRKQTVDTVLNNLDVQAVPCVIIIKDNNVEKLYYYDEINNNILSADIESYISDGIVFN